MSWAVVTIIGLLKIFVSLLMIKWLKGGKARLINLLINVIYLISIFVLGFEIRASPREIAVKIVSLVLIGNIIVISIFLLPTRRS